MLVLVLINTIPLTIYPVQKKEQNAKGIYHLAEHVEDADVGDQHRGARLVEAHAHRVVRYVHVGHVVPHVEEEVGHGEHQEGGAPEVRQVQHIHGEVPEVPQPRVPLHLENAGRSL